MKKGGHRGAPRRFLHSLSIQAGCEHPLALSHRLERLGYDPAPSVVGLVHGELAVDLDSSLALALGELATMADFVEYFDAKEAFVRGGRLVAAAGEEDLLAYFLRSMTTDNRHGFSVSPKLDGVVIDEGYWEQLQGGPEYIAKQQADRISALWDLMIEDISANALNDHLYSPSGESSPSLVSTERALRVLASKNRVRQRMLSRELASKISGQGAEKNQTFRLLLPATPMEAACMILAIPPEHETPPSPEHEEEYPRVRRGLLEPFGLVVLRT